MWPFGRKKEYLNKEDQARVVACIQHAEQNTTGELRVFIEGKCGYVDPMERAKEIFAKLGMAETVKRNAVLVYLAIEDHQYAILGDEQIYVQAGGATFWKSAAAAFRSYLSKGEIAEGLCACINELGTALATHFPYDPQVTKNELPDEIVFGK